MVIANLNDFAYGSETSEREKKMAENTPAEKPLRLTETVKGAG